MDTSIVDEVPGAIEGDDGITTMLNDCCGGGEPEPDDPPPQPTNAKNRADNPAVATAFILRDGRQLTGTARIFMSTNRPRSSPHSLSRKRDDT